MIFLTIYILNTLVQNLLIDPYRTEFLSHKTDVRDSFNPSVWLTVMYVHVIFACAAALAGALNFYIKTADNHKRFHRLNGYVYVVCVLAVTLTSGYMAPYSTGGKMISVPFNMVNIFWPAITVISILLAKRKQFVKHRNWMIRSYMFCFTNLFIHFILSICSKGMGLSYETSYAIGVYGAIGMNVAIAELIIRKISFGASEITE